MISYELAVKLKEAGFPQKDPTTAYLNELDHFGRRVVLIHTGGGHNGNEGLYTVKGHTCCLDEYNKEDSRVDINDFIKNVEDKDLIRIPTLSELIEHILAIGDETSEPINFKLICLNVDPRSSVYAFGIHQEGHPIIGIEYFSSPEEAVANLYLAINKK